MHFFVSTYSFSVEMVKINVSCLQKYNKNSQNKKKLEKYVRRMQKSITFAFDLIKILSCYGKNHIPRRICS